MQYRLEITYQKSIFNVTLKDPPPHDVKKWRFWPIFFAFWIAWNMLRIFHTKNFLVGLQIFWKNFNWNFQFWSLTSRLCSLFYLFRGFLGLQTAFDCLMGDLTRFCVVLGIKWRFLKFSDFREIELVLFANKKINFLHRVDFSLISYITHKGVKFILR